MNQAIGIIEIEADGALGPAEFADSFDDATLDSLFARLVAPHRFEVIEQPVVGDSDSPTTIVAANLEFLVDDLDAATRQVLAGIFLGYGRR